MKTLPLTMIEPGLYGYRNNGNLNGFFDFLSAGAGVVATGAGTASALITAGAAAQAVPVIGTIAGAVTLLAGGIARIVSKAKAGKATTSEIKSQIAEVDALIAQGNTNKANILAEMNRLGISGFEGLGSLKSWLQKTFTPARYYANEAESLTAQLNEKIATAQALQAELEALQIKLTTGKAAGLPSFVNNILPASLTPTAKKVIFYGTGAVVVGTALYFIFKKKKS